MSLEEKSRLVRLSERASDLLVRIVDEDLPSARQATDNDIEFGKALSQINQICPLLADSYRVMYNYIQEQKILPEHNYYKKLRKQGLRKQ